MKNVSLCDFADNPNTEIIKINNWVSDNTNGLIPSLLEEDSLDDNTIFVPVNTLYFKAELEIAFDVKDTEKIEFTMCQGICDVNMMNKFGRV